MPLVLTDTFDRPDSATLGLSWTEGGGAFGSALEIVSNAVKIVSGVNENTAYWTGVSGSDICAAFTISTLSTVDFDPFPFFVRVGDTGAGIQAYLRFGGAASRTVVSMWRSVVEDVEIILSATFVAGDAICVRLLDDQDPTVTVYVYRQAGATGPWVLVGSADLQVRVAGPYYPGIGIYDNTTTVLDAFYTGTGSPTFEGEPAFPTPRIRSRRTSW